MTKCVTSSKPPQTRGVEGSRRQHSLETVEIMKVLPAFERRRDNVCSAGHGCNIFNCAQCRQGAGCADALRVDEWQLNTIGASNPSSPSRPRSRWGIVELADSRQRASKSVVETYSLNSLKETSLRASPKGAPAHQSLQANRRAFSTKTRSSGMCYERFRILTSSQRPKGRWPTYSPSISDPTLCRV